VRVLFTEGRPDGLLSVGYGEFWPRGTVTAIRLSATGPKTRAAKHASPRLGEIRFPTHGGVYVWEFEQVGRRPVNVRVEGQLVVNDIALARLGAIDGSGIAYLPENYVQPHMDSGELVRVLADWCPPFPGYHLYYASRRQQSPALAVIVDALRYRG
jgi:DNA-binding transcriptional LysR family regulator